MPVSCSVTHRAVGAIFLAASLTACQPLPPPEPRPEGGFVELDENTDPRFIRYDRAGAIGWLRVAGGNVYLDGRIADRDQRLPNNAHVRTGPGSGVRAELEYGSGRGCRVALREFHQGNLYGESGTCEHELGSREAIARSEEARTTYHATARGESTVVTVIAGQMRAWSNRDPSRTVLVGAMQEVLLRPGAVVGPRPVTEAQVRERTAWRAAFDWAGRARADAVCKRYAGTAVEQNDQNLRRSCGYTGARWQSEYDYHYRWCVEGDNARRADRETAARAQALETCGQTGRGSEAAETILHTLFDAFISGSQRSRESSPSRDSGPTPTTEPTPPITGDSAGTPSATDLGRLRELRATEALRTPAADTPTLDLRRLEGLRRIESTTEPGSDLR